MAILSDEQFLQALAQTPEILPRSLWAHLNGIAEFLALMGATDEALNVWKFAYSNLVPVPEHASAFGDCSVSALCWWSKIEDFSHGKPRSSFSGANATLSQRIGDFAREMRLRFTTDVWSPAIPIEHIELARRARALASPTKGEQFSANELEALPWLERYVAHPEAQHHAISHSHLLYADIAQRNELHDQARQHLIWWREKATWYSVFLSEVFALPTLANLAFNGTLAGFSNLDPAERQAQVESLLRDLSLRLLDPYSAVKAPQFLETPIFHPSFILEPAQETNPEEFAMMNSEGETVWDNENYPTFINAPTPGDTGSCRFEIEQAQSPPDWKAADYVVALPFRALPNENAGQLQSRVGNVFITTTVGEKEDRGLEVVPGDYDVLARFFLELGDPEDEAVGLRHWRVQLTFLPRATLTRFGIYQAYAENF